MYLWHHYGYAFRFYSNIGTGYTTGIQHLASVDASESLPEHPIGARYSCAMGLSDALS